MARDYSGALDDNTDGCARNHDITPDFLSS